MDHPFRRAGATLAAGLLLSLGAVPATAQPGGHHQVRAYTLTGDPEG